MIIKVFLRLLLLCAHIVCIDGKLVRNFVKENKKTLMEIQEIRPVVSGVRIESDVDASGFLGYG